MSTGISRPRPILWALATLVCLLGTSQLPSRAEGTTAVYAPTPAPTSDQRIYTGTIVAFEVTHAPFAAHLTLRAANGEVRVFDLAAHALLDRVPFHCDALPESESAYSQLYAQLGWCPAPHGLLVGKIVRVSYWRTDSGYGTAAIFSQVPPGTIIEHAKT
jgi:hypothetical protein